MQIIIIKQMELSIIYSHSLNNFIDNGGDLFQADADKKNFYRQTTYSPTVQSNAIIVGRKTWDKLPSLMKRCPYRDYYVVTNTESISDCKFYGSFRRCLEEIYHNRSKYYKTFVIGGAQIYKLAMQTDLVTEIIETIYNMTVPEENSTQLEINYSSGKYRIVNQTVMSDITINHHVKLSKPFETQYLNLVHEIKTFGTKKVARNDTTLSVTDRTIKIDLSDGFPLLTIKPVYWRGVVEEAMWMLRGSTNVKELREKKVRIWDGNSTREFLDKQGLKHLDVDDIGPGYGFQFRHSGATYINCLTDYTGAGVDQLQKCIDLIKNNPNDRRIIIELWNPSQLKEMALPPCHKTYQFTVTNNKLSCHLYQRSWDIMLGWNTSTAAFITHLLAHYCGLDVGTVTHTICDVHIYQSHLTDEFEKVLSRLPYKLPILSINCDVPANINDYQFDNFVLNDYEHHGKIDMKMVV